MKDIWQNLMAVIICSFAAGVLVGDWPLLAAINVMLTGANVAVIADTLRPKVIS